MVSTPTFKIMKSIDKTISDRREIIKMNWHMSGWLIEHRWRGFNGFTRI